MFGDPRWPMIGMVGKSLLCGAIAADAAGVWLCLAGAAFEAAFILPYNALHPIRNRPPLHDGPGTESYERWLQNRYGQKP